MFQYLTKVQTETRNFSWQCQIKFARGSRGKVLVISEELHVLVEGVVAGAPGHGQHEGHDDDGDADREEREKQQSLNNWQIVPPIRNIVLTQAIPL